MTKAGPRGLFITGTCTAVGKTHAACCIARVLRGAGRRVGVYKPVASGCVSRGGRLIAEDAEQLWLAAGQPETLEAVCPQRFAAPLAPPLAAQQAGTRVDPGLLRSGLQWWLERSEILIVEGSGGLMSPLSDEDYVADLVQEFAFPLVVVAPNQLGVINQVLQTLITAATFREGLPVAGIVLNDLGYSAEQDPSIVTNRRQLEIHCVPPVLGHLAWQAAAFQEPIDWWSLARNDRTEC